MCFDFSLMYNVFVKKVFVDIETCFSYLVVLVRVFDSDSKNGKTVFGDSRRGHK